MVNTRFDGGDILARKLNTFLPLSPAELKCLAEIQLQPFSVMRGRQLTQEGQTEHKAFVLKAGWACSYRVLPDGARQIISFPMPVTLSGSAESSPHCRSLVPSLDRCPGEPGGWPP